MPMTPQSRPVPVIITRPEPSASRFAQELTGRFGGRVLPVLSPALALRFLSPTRPNGDFGALVFSSEAAVAAAQRLTGWNLPNRAYCVGDRTAQVAKDAGFDAISAGGDARDLLALLQTAREHAPFLHLRGAEVAADIAGELAALGIKAEAIACYAQDDQPLTRQALGLLTGNIPLILPLFSPRTARIVASQFPARLNPNLQILCLSPAIAAVLGALPCVIADQPDGPALMRLMERALEPSALGGLG